VTRPRAESGFSLIELLFATGLLLVVTSIVTTALMQMSGSQKTIWNRTEMHSGIRGATELLQQEVGQAGRITLPATGVVTLTNAITTVPAYAAACTALTNLAISSTAGMWGSAATGIALTFLDGDNEETVRVTSITGNTINACFWHNHIAGTPIRALGGFATGVIPPSGIVHGSDDTHLKLFGDINGDGNMVYVEYFCDTDNHKLYRNPVAFNAGSLPPNDDSMVLLGNIQPNPPDSGGVARACFSYQVAEATVNSTLFTFVTDVAITLTVETEQVDSITQQKQQETKALLNVSPRNVFNAYAFAGLSQSDRIQSTPATVTNLVCTGAVITCP